MARTIHVRIVSPEKLVYEGDATALVVPVWDGQVGILPGHAPMLALVGAGELSVKVSGAHTQRYHVAGGVLKVEATGVTVLTEYAGTTPATSLSPGTIVRPEDVAEAALRRD